MSGPLYTRADRGAPSLHRYLPLVALATLAVVVMPVLAVAAIQTSARPLPAAVSVAVAMLLSVAAASLGSALWMRQAQSHDLVFGDLIIWGWMRRLRAESRLADATELLTAGGAGSHAPAPAAARRAEVLRRLAAALEATDPQTHRHTQRVTRHAEMIARRMGLPSQQVASVRAAAALHDVGKINTPRSILEKPGVLSDDERAVIERHAIDGAEMVSASGDRELTAIVRHHHERVDGTGYPDGLEGEEIPLGARIIAVADTFDALTSSRSYRLACTHKTAVDVLATKSGTQLDADAAAAFLSYYSGRRLVAVSALVVAAPQRLLGWLGNAIYGAGAAPLAKSASAAGATVVIGGSILSPVAPGQARDAMPSSQAAAKISHPALGTPESAEDRPARAGRTAARRRSKPPAGGVAPPRSRPKRPLAEPAEPPATPRQLGGQAPSGPPGEVKLALARDELPPANAQETLAPAPLPRPPPAPELPATPELQAIPEPRAILEPPPSIDVPPAPGV